MAEKKKELFKKQSSNKIQELDKKYEERVNSKEQSKRVYSDLLEEKVKEKETWMTNIMRKAVIRHKELEKECDQTSKIKPDKTTVNDQGVKNEAFSEEAWKKKSEPFTKLETLSTQIDKVFDNPIVSEFEKLEKLLK